jgi:predicted nucleic acid-binding protein
VILVDTGPIVAVINDRDDHHRECTYLLERLPGSLLIPATVATEVCLMLERRRGTYAELAFLSRCAGWAVHADRVVVRRS